jgi:two-component system nitrogen regulation response regulator GlnG
MTALELRPSLRNGAAAYFSLAVRRPPSAGHVRRPWRSSASDGMYDRVISEVERPLLSLALGATRGNQLRAARLLGLNRNTLRKKIKDLDVPVVRTPQVRRGG